MSQNTTPTSEAPPPHAQLIQMVLGHWVSRIIYAAAELGLADHLAAGPQTAESLAGVTRTNAAALYRLLRTLANFGVVTEGAERRFALTPLGEALKTGAPGAARATILTFGGDLMTETWRHVVYSVQTGKPAVDKAVGMPIFDWLAKHPAEASLFGETMIGFHGAEPAAIAAAYDFSKLGTIIDVGGGTGNLLTTILGAHAQPRGVLFDLPHVKADATDLIQKRGLANRVSMQTGSFFESVPTGGDAYILSHVIHDWSEEQCVTILAHCRRAMKPGSRLLIIEMVLPPGNTPHPGKLLDIMMLVGPGGQERTADEYRALLAKAGFRLAARSARRTNTARCSPRPAFAWSASCPRPPR
jgi:hypothetical protein